MLQRLQELGPPLALALAIAPPPPPVRDLEADLLAGATQRQQRIKTNGSANSGGGSSSSDLLHADVEKLLQQREQLRARLIAEQERRERAEAELVGLGAQWLGTDTQQALRERAEAERQRALDAERNQLRRDAEQKIGQVRAENALLRSKLGSNAPTELELRMELRSAVTAELMR